ncbi:hypothetical protein [Microbacterium lacticum]|uniref:hypothetical protein n=1 Tax=Microbacterium lacticum TaxID=33885 RepID=UPI00242F558D|nr:hypothetical protein [Microbacterium lacticum]
MTGEIVYLRSRVPLLVLIGDCWRSLREPFARDLCLDLVHPVAERILSLLDRVDLVRVSKQSRRVGV